MNLNCLKDEIDLDTCREEVLPTEMGDSQVGLMLQAHPSDKGL